MIALLLACIMLLATGCGDEFSITLKKNGTVASASLEYYYTEEIEAMFTEDETVNADCVKEVTSTAEKKDVNGTTYYKLPGRYYSIDEMRQSYTQYGTFYEEEMNDFIKEDMESTVINGSTYYYLKKSGVLETLNGDNLKKHYDAYFDSSAFEFASGALGLNGSPTLKSYLSAAKTGDCTFTIKFPYKVYAANGTISEDSYSVTYDVGSKFAKYYKKGFRLYAAFTEEAKNGKKLAKSSKTVR